MHSDDAALMEEFRRDLVGARGLSPFTVRNYLTDLRRFLDFLDHQGLSATTADRAAYRLYAIEQKDAGRTSYSRTRAATTLRQFYLHLQQEKKVTLLRPSDISIPKREKRIPRYLTEDEAARLME